MWRIPMLLCAVALPATFLIVGCATGASQGQGGGQDHTTHHRGANVKLNLRPEHNFGVSGTASFGDTSDGVVVKLEVRNLPKPNTLYLAHIHPGTCATGETHEHGVCMAGKGTPTNTAAPVTNTGGTTHEHGGAEIEYALSQVKSDSEGHGSSTTTLRDTTVEKLFSGDPKYVNVHEAGSGNPPS